VLLPALHCADIVSTAGESVYPAVTTTTWSKEMQSAQFRFELPGGDWQQTWATVQITQQTDYIFTLSAWVENANGSTDALYSFLEGYVFQSHGGQICFDNITDAIKFVRDAMRELGFTIKARN
jgi:hypothetical protein